MTNRPDEKSRIFEVFQTPLTSIGDGTHRNHDRVNIGDYSMVGGWGVPKSPGWEIAQLDGPEWETPHSGLEGCWALPHTPGSHQTPTEPINEP